MNVFQYAMSCEQMFEGFLNDVGKKRKTTFFSDLSIAECYGINEIKDTYKRVLKAWKTDVVFMSEFVIALNQKIWQHYKDNKPLSKVYDELWRQADEFCMDNFKEEDLIYYLRYTD